MDHIDRWNILEPDSIAVELPDRSVTYRELSTLVSRGGGALAGFGVKPGDRVAVWVKNDLPSLVALWAVPRMGGVVVPISSRLTHLEVMAQLDLVDPALILGSDALTGRTTHATGSLFDGRPTMPHPHAPDELHSIFFTSGTSGEPKGARLTWGNHEASAAASAAAQPVGPDDGWLAVMPLFHVGGFAITYRMFRAGGTVVLESSFEAARVATVLPAVSYASLVATMVRSLLEEAGEDGLEGPSAAILVGGSAFPIGLQKAALAAGLPVVASYGMTETGSQVATAAVGDNPGSGAPPLEGVTITAGSEGRPGPITVDGPMVSPGYWGEPDRTGAFSTRDVGFFDAAGRLHVLGREDDVIITGGENVHPVEVEGALEQHPGVAAAAVFGVADPEWGERLEAAVVLRDATVSVAEIEAELREQLAGYKIPKAIHVVPDLPLGPTGKVDRSALAAIVIPSPGGEGGSGA
jgi:O-succinylbenzoic acid--CoA ligase